VTDPLGSLPDYKNKLHAFVARGVNAKRGRFDKFWSADGRCDIEQLTDEETLKDIVYIYTNPLEAGLVKWVRQWPGFSTYGWKFGEVHRFRRPKWFYDPDNPDLPEFVEIKLVRPDIFRHLSDDELYDLIMTRVRERELEIQREMADKGRRFMGLNKLRKQKWNRAAKSIEERFTLTPTVASTCKWTRIARLQRKRLGARVRQGPHLAAGRRGLRVSVRHVLDASLRRRASRHRPLICATSEIGGAALASPPICIGFASETRAPRPAGP
jgi:hypothetical protein